MTGGPPAQSDPDRQSIPARLHVLTVVLIVVLGSALYYNSLKTPFHFDDNQSIANNRHIRVTEWDLGKFYDAARIGRTHGNNGRPVAFLSFALNYYFATKSSAGMPVTWGFHLVNIVIHVVTGILVYFVAVMTLGLWNACRRRAGSLEPLPVYAIALFTAGLFIAHPIQTQAVTYVVQRMTSMATMFYMAALLLYILGRAVESRNARIGYWAAAVLLWGVALLTKQIVVTLPVVILLYEWFFFRDLDFAWMKQAMFRFVLPALLVIAVLSLAYTGGDPFAQFEKGYAERSFTMAERLYTQPRVVMFYLSLVAYPAPGRQSLIHLIDTSHSLVDPISSLLSLGVLIGLFATAIVIARRYRLVSFGILWFLINLALESSFPALEMIYEHRMYLPMFGVSLAVASILFSVPPRFRNYAVIAAILLVAACSVSTIKRNQGWRSQYEFWKDLAERADNLSDRAREDNRVGIARTYNNYANKLRDRGLREEGYATLLRAIEADPDYPTAHFNLGLIHMDNKQDDLAVAEFTKAIEGEPKYVMALFRRAQIYSRQGKNAEAMKDLSEAIRKNEHFSLAYYQRGRGFSSQGKLDLAIKDFTETIRLEPHAPEPYTERGKCYEKKGDTEAAQRDYRMAEQLKDEDKPGRDLSDRRNQLLEREGGD